MFTLLLIGQNSPKTINNAQQRAIRDLSFWWTDESVYFVATWSQCFVDKITLHYYFSLCSGIWRLVDGPTHWQPHCVSSEA